VKHIIEYIYEKWKNNQIEFKNPKESEESVKFTYHDPCRLSRFLPKDNKIVENVREIFNHLNKLGYEFNEMAHNKQNSLCCGVSSWMNCNDRSKALRYKRLLEAKDVSTMMITSCPKCKIHLSCLQNDYEDISSIEIMDFSEFIVNLVNVKDLNKNVEVEE
ncbi:MAG: (Fe-S)-binding protein, partial [Asgard group archaeon]|nr:(Fe-S)-binding protein [Asgard group archaeon]